MAQCVVIGNVTVGGVASAEQTLVVSAADPCTTLVVMTADEFAAFAPKNDADYYNACLSIFAAGLVALSVIFGGKRVLAMLNHSRSE